MVANLNSTPEQQNSIDTKWYNFQLRRLKTGSSMMSICSFIVPKVTSRTNPASSVAGRAPARESGGTQNESHVSWFSLPPKIGLEKLSDEWIFTNLALCKFSSFRHSHASLMQLLHYVTCPAPSQAYQLSILRNVERSWDNFRWVQSCKCTGSIIFACREGERESRERERDSPK